MHQALWKTVFKHLKKFVDTPGPFFIYCIFLAYELNFSVAEICDVEIFCEAVVEDVEIRDTSDDVFVDEDNVSMFKNSRIDGDLFRILRSSYISSASQSSPSQSNGSSSYSMLILL